MQPAISRKDAILNWLISPSENFAASAEIFCDVALFAFTLGVLVFIALEYAADHLDDWTWGYLRRKIWIFGVLGCLAGEFIFEVGSFTYAYDLQSRQSDRIEALTGKANAAEHNADIANATAQGALTNALTAQGDATNALGVASNATARVQNATTRLVVLTTTEQTLQSKIDADEHELAPRWAITAIQKKEIIDSMRGVASPAMVFGLCEPEAREYAGWISQWLSEAGHPQTGMFILTDKDNNPVIRPEYDCTHACFQYFDPKFDLTWAARSAGVTLMGTDAEKPAMLALKKALEDSGVYVTDLYRVEDNSPVPTMIFVGLRITPFAVSSGVRTPRK